MPLIVSNKHFHVPLIVPDSHVYMPLIVLDGHFYVHPECEEFYFLLDCETIKDQIRTTNMSLNSAK